jgi:hypothetical protein
MINAVIITGTNSSFNKHIIDDVTSRSTTMELLFAISDLLNAFHPGDEEHSITLQRLAHN